MKTLEITATAYRADWYIATVKHGARTGCGFATNKVGAISEALRDLILCRMIYQQ